MAVLIQPEQGSTVAGLQSFNSYSELNSYLDNNSVTKGLVASPSTDQTSMTGTATQDHSTTNVQVADVQEEDRVITDGVFIYSAGQTTVSVVNVFPASEMRNVSSLNMSQILESGQASSIYIMGLYLTEDKLVVICQQSSYSHNDKIYAQSVLAPAYQLWTTRTTVSIFDMSDPGAPLLKQTAGISGTFTTSRMHGYDLYVFSTQYAWDSASGSAAIPSSFEGGNDVQFEPGKILYDPQTVEVSCFLNLIRLNVANADSDEMSFLTGYSSVLYVSEDNIYVTYAHYSYSMPSMMDDGVVSSSTPAQSYTTIYKIDVAGSGMQLKASGTVRGTLVDRYAIDERNGYLRIATTDYSNGTQTLVSVTSSNLSLVGQIGGIGKGETMQSSRYINDTLYLVTYRQVDPLFAIDLSDPKTPMILGELTMPGFSTYLHPVDGMHLIGLGFEGHSMKVSLYNVSDRTHPMEEQKLLLSNFSYSPALYDPHAVTFDPSRSLLVVPVSGYDDGSYQYHCAAYVFNTSGGISLVGMVGSNNSGGVDRTLYVDDTLYVCSQYCISSYRMSDLSYRGAIVLGTYSPYWSWYCGGDLIPMALGIK
ncbi:MAG: beta-propeller domain-containing protein [Methanomassiliicoccales archaeon]